MYSNPHVTNPFGPDPPAFPTKESAKLYDQMRNFLLEKWDDSQLEEYDFLPGGWWSNLTDNTKEAIYWFSDQYRESGAYPPPPNEIHNQIYTALLESFWESVAPEYDEEGIPRVINLVDKAQIRVEERDDPHYGKLFYKDRALNMYEYLLAEYGPLLDQERAGKEAPLRKRGESWRTWKKRRRMGRNPDYNVPDWSEIKVGDLFHFVMHNQPGSPLAEYFVLHLRPSDYQTIVFSSHPPDQMQYQAEHIRH